MAHLLAVQTLVFHPTLGVFASGSTDGSIKIWDLQSTRVLRTLQGVEAVIALAFSKDGRWLAAGGWNWNTRRKPSKPY